MYTLDETSAVTLAAEVGLLPTGGGTGRLLDGGFMNTVIRVEQEGATPVVLKQALPTLREFPDIAVTPNRLRYEYEALEFFAEHAPWPGAEVPRPLWFDPERNVLAMTDLGRGRRRLEQALVAGEADATVAANLGRFLAALHTRTADRADLRHQFANDAMHQLRLQFCFFGFCEDPQVVPHIEALAQAFTERKRVLLHGDFWTASVLVDGATPGVYDLEFCNYGDPAQDAGFMLAHYMLHYYNAPAAADGVRGAVDGFWSAYQAEAGYDRDAGFESRVVQQIGVEMLFRVSGINTVAYVTDTDRRAAIMMAAKRYIVDPAGGIATLWT